MTAKKSAYLCAVLSVLFILSVFINDVNAKSSSSHGHGHSGSHSTHHSSGHSISHSKDTKIHKHPSHSPGGKSSPGHSYPAPPKHSLSGNSGSSSNRDHPATNLLSGSGSKPGFALHPSKKLETSGGTPVPSHITSQKSSLSGSSNKLSGHSYPSPNTQIGSGSQSGSANGGSAGHSYPTPRPNSLSGGASGSSGTSYPINTQTNFGNQHKPVQYPSPPLGVTSGSAVHSYPTPRPNSLSGGASGSSASGYPINTQTNIGNQHRPVQYLSPPISATSGSAVHSYPTPRPNSLSGGASGSSATGYPINTQTNIGNQHRPVQYPSPPISATSGSAVHSYPTSRPNSLSGGGSSSGNKVGSVSYPKSNELSGNKVNGYQTSGSSNTQNTYHKIHHNTNWGSNTQVHHVPRGGHPIVYHNHHYVYNPPTVIHYGTSSINYPVYMGVPPSYVYEYRSSGNKYSNLLTGLSLYNLGRMSTNSYSHHYHSQYKPQPDEYCKFGIQYGTGMFEEMSIDCRAITYFIYEDQPRIQTHITTNIMNQTIVTTQQMFSNGSLVEPKNMPNQNRTVTTQRMYSNGSLIEPNNMQSQMLNSNGLLPSLTQQMNMTSMTMTTTKGTSVTDDRFIGGPVEIKPNMVCYVTRNTMFTNMKKSVPCELLQKYSTSLHNSGAKVKSPLVLILVAFALGLYQ